MKYINNIVNYINLGRQGQFSWGRKNWLIKVHIVDWLIDWSPYSWLIDWLKSISLIDWLIEVHIVDWLIDLSQYSWLIDWRQYSWLIDCLSELRKGLAEYRCFGRAPNDSAVELNIYIFFIKKCYFFFYKKKLFFFYKKNLWIYLYITTNICIVL